MNNYVFKVLIFFSAFLLFSSVAFATNDTNTLDFAEKSNEMEDISENVLLRGSTIQSSDLVKYYLNNTQFQATFFDSNNDPLSNTNVFVKINGVTYTRTTNAQGGITFTINLGPGIYPITLTNPIDGSFVTNTVTVLPTVLGADITKYYLNGTQYYVTILNGQGNPIANTGVTMNINGVFYTRNTDSNGVAILSINLLPNTYIITVTHPIDGLQMSNTVTVLSTVLGNDLVKFFTESKSYDVKVVNGQGNPIVNTLVQININGVVYDRYTDSSGIAKLSINLYPGMYIATATSGGLSRSHNVYVYNGVPENLNNVFITPITKYIQNGGVYEVKLTENNGLPLANKNIKINVNSVNYYANTDVQGIARFTLNLNPGTYNVTSSYGATEKSRLLVVSAANNGIETVLTPLTSALSTGSLFSVKLTNKNNGAALANQDVIFYVNGYEYTRTTDSNGIASLTINFVNPIVYPISISFAGTTSGTLYKPSSAYKLFYVSNSPTDLTYSYPVYPDNAVSGYWINPPITSLVEEISCLNNNYIISLSDYLTKYRVLDF